MVRNYFAEAAESTGAAVVVSAGAASSVAGASSTVASVFSVASSFGLFSQAAKVNKPAIANNANNCFSLWEKHRFYFKITRSRNSKLGDYKYDPVRRLHTVSVNSDLNCYSFLITYLHEVAHLITFTEKKRKTEPHGPEWKLNFIQLMMPVLNEKVFPTELLWVLLMHMKNPKASSYSDHKLVGALRKFDKNNNPEELILSELKIGNRFVLNSRIFEKEEVRRTRALCKELSSGRKFLISQLAKVGLVS